MWIRLRQIIKMFVATQKAENAHACDGREDVLRQTEHVLHVFGFQGRLYHILELGDVDRGKRITVGHLLTKNTNTSITLHIKS